MEAVIDFAGHTALVEVLKQGDISGYPARELGAGDRGCADLTLYSPRPGRTAHHHVSEGIAVSGSAVHTDMRPPPRLLGRASRVDEPDTQKAY